MCAWAAPSSANAPRRSDPALGRFVALELELEDAPEVGLSPDEKQEEEEGPRPQVVFYASGEAMVGAINVRQQDSEDLLWRLEWDLLGRFKVLRRGEPDEEDEGEEDN